MRLRVQTILLKRLSAEKEFSSEEYVDMREGIESAFGYRDTDETTVQIRTEVLGEAPLKKLLSYLDDPTKFKKGKFLKGQLNSWLKIKDNPMGVTVSSLDSLEEALIAYMLKAPEHLLFANTDNSFLPYLVTHIQYHPPDETRSGDYEPAYVSISLSYHSVGSEGSSTISIESQDLRGGATVKELLESEGYSLGNDAIFKKYEKELKLFREWVPQVGRQFLGTGSCETYKGYRSGRKTLLEVEGVKHKLVIDTPDDYEDKSERDEVRYLDSEAEDSDTSFPVPTHPYLILFDLSLHQQQKVHVNNLEPYIYDPSLGEKLILPAGNKNLIDILVQGTEDIMEDIIEGKTGGIIVMATGVPGTGKTLTAEVYSEVVERPLYVVQCSQLGIELDDLEKNLKTVLERANRWGAILLIDEADVYIHTRGDDLTQNAVVGVFLRVLEYYSGLLFMTSNRGTIIDDAILSRATAHIRYGKPTPDELKQIWRILSDQFDAGITDEVIGKLVERFPNIVGRDVKNLTKLAKLLAIRQKKKIDVGLVEYVSEFQDLSENDGDGVT